MNKADLETVREYYRRPKFPKNLGLGELNTYFRLSPATGRWPRPSTSPSKTSPSASASASQVQGNCPTEWNKGDLSCQGVEGESLCWKLSWLNILRRRRRRRRPHVCRTFAGITSGRLSWAFALVRLDYFEPWCGPNGPTPKLAAIKRPRFSSELYTTLHAAVRSCKFSEQTCQDLLMDSMLSSRVK